jgi:hypothetical protein
VFWLVLDSITVADAPRCFVLSGLTREDSAALLIPSFLYGFVLFPFGFVFTSLTLCLQSSRSFATFAPSFHVLDGKIDKDAPEFKVCHLIPSLSCKQQLNSLLQKNAEEMDKLLAQFRSKIDHVKNGSLLFANVSRHRSLSFIRW